MGFFRKWILRLVGWLLCVPAILLGPVARLTRSDVSRPWVDGLLHNTWRAYKKYDAGSWLRRMAGIYHNPDLTLQYWAILTTRKNVRLAGEEEARVGTLRPAHDIQTTHAHHRLRVARARRGEVPTSDYGRIIVVGDVVHDGNHRVGALREANYSAPVPVMRWEEV